VEKSLPPIPAKRYFTIGEVSELCGVKPYVLRYWEQEFTQLKPMKRRGNRRYYQHHEVLLVRRIRDLLYEQGFTISGARNRLSEVGGRGGAAARAAAAPEDRVAADAQAPSDEVVPVVLPPGVEFDRRAKSGSPGSVGSAAAQPPDATPEAPLPATPEALAPAVRGAARELVREPALSADALVQGLQATTAARLPKLTRAQLRAELQAIRELLSG